MSSQGWCDTCGCRIPSNRKQCGGCAPRPYTPADVKALATLFRKRRESDNMTILDDMVIAAGLLNAHSGEIGYALANKFTAFVLAAREAQKPFAGVGEKEKP